MQHPVLSVRNLSIEYTGERQSGFAVKALSFDVGNGETVALVGESGCGKSTTALAILNLLPLASKQAGRILLDGKDIAALDEDALPALRGRDIGIIFQEPMTSLNPIYTIGRQIGEALLAHSQLSRPAVRARTLELLDLVAIPDPRRRIDAYPHELSGGQRQRVMIAMAIALSPRLLIADEPTTALDATTQQQILELIKKLQRDLSMSVLLISHDLAMVSRWTDRAIVMHQGRKIEEIPSGRIGSDATHDYTKGLIRASLTLGDGRHYLTARLPEIRTTPLSDGDVRFDVLTPAVSPPPPSPNRETILSVDGLVVDYSGARGRFRAVNDVSLTVGAGETLGLMGESGSGKSSLSRALMRLVDVTAGSIRFEGRDITHLRGSALRKLRRDIQMIFQDPYASLNPRHTIREILEAPLILHGLNDPVVRDKRIATTLDQVGLAQSALARFPHEFSGGQRQRIGIARALINRPKFIICDEPVSALDVSVQAQILNLLSNLKQEYSLSYLFISHDIAVIQYISDRIVVMKDGQFVETGGREELFLNPRDSYTRQLLGAAAGGTC